MKKIRSNFGHWWSLFVENLFFMLMLIITYTFAVLFIYFSWYKESRFSNTDSVGYVEFLEIVISNLIPTTLVYVLSCTIANIMDITKRNNGVSIFNRDYPFNIVTIVLIVMYAITYCIYMTRMFSIGVFTLEIIFTIFILIFNVKSYKEIKINCARNIA